MENKFKLPEYIEVEYRFNCKDVNFNDMFGITILKNDFIENQCLSQFRLDLLR